VLGQALDGVQVPVLRPRRSSPELHVLDHSLFDVIHFCAPFLETVILSTHRWGTAEGA